MVITDLDGSLLQSNHRISETDYKTLITLGEMKILRVIATGRNLYSANKVLANNFPIDYLIISSGAGIIDWKSKKMILSYDMKPDEVEIATKELINEKMDFMIHKPVPDNHYFTYFYTGKNNPDFFRRIELYKDFAYKTDYKFCNSCRASQLLAIEVNHSNSSKYELIKEKLYMLKIIKTTSPLDKQSLWIEIFPKTVSKALAGKWIAHKENINKKNIISIGNDYNDIDLLQWTDLSYVVDNAPEKLKEIYPFVSSNDNNGFTEAIELWINK